MYTYFVAFDYYDYVSRENNKGNSVVKSPEKIECRYDVIKIESDIEDTLDRGINVVLNNFILLYVED